MQPARPLQLPRACGPLTRKLSWFTELDQTDREVLDDLCGGEQRLGSGSDLIAEGDRPQDVFLLIEGWGYRYKLLPDGRRHILAYLMPGDLCDVRVFILKEMDHAIGVLNDARYVAIPKHKMRKVMRESPSIGEALWWATLVDEAILREWLVNLGQRSAYERIAHLIFEVWSRLDMIGQTDGHAFEFPVTQTELADTVGLTPVHVNRTMQRLREDGLLTMRGQLVTILEPERLRSIAGFDPNYLHLERRADRLNAD